MDNSVQSFKDYHEAFFMNENPGKAKELASEFFRGFILSMSEKTVLLETFLNQRKIDDFYNLLSDFKFLVEYSDEISRYWYFLRAYSGALAKLNSDRSVKGAKKLYSYYFEKYGDRRTIRDEHWFEKKRWEFLDELYGIFNEYELEAFIKKFQNILTENFATYSSLLLTFVFDLKGLQVNSKIETRLGA
jgi:hypothetical protein